MHPLGGLDHQLAMILVGIFAYQLGGRALWLVPLTFVGIMALGGFLAASPAYRCRSSRSASRFQSSCSGAIVAFGVKVPVAVAMGIVGLFAIFHGHAHGSEMPMDASGIEYGLGFMLATGIAACGRHWYRLHDRHDHKVARQQCLSRRRRTCAFVAGVGILLGTILISSNVRRA